MTAPRNGAAPSRRGRVLRRVLLLAGLAALLLLTVFTTLAVAQNPLPCKQPPGVDVPGNGLVGQIDPTPIGNGQSHSLYDEVGNGGLTWHTWGYSGACAANDPGVHTDTWAANELFNVAKLVTATTNGLHYQLQTGGMLDQFDDLVAELSITLYDGVFVPYIGLALTLAGIGMLLLVLRGNLPAVGTKLLWITAGLATAGGFYLTPLAYTQIVDAVLVDGITELQHNLLALGGFDDARDGLPTLLHRETVVEPWRLGALGNTSHAADHARALAFAQTCTKEEVLRQSCDIQAKQDAFRALADRLDGTPAYPHFTGEQRRLGAAGLAIARALAFDALQIAAMIGVFLGQLVLRLAILAGPVIGLVAVVSNTALPRVVKALGVACVHIVVLATTAIVHVLILDWVTNQGFTPLTELLVLAVVALIAWVAVRPGHRLRTMTAATVGIDPPSPHERRMAAYARRQARRFRRQDRGGLLSFLAGGHRDSTAAPPVPAGDEGPVPTAAATRPAGRPERRAVLTAVSERRALTTAAGGSSSAGPVPALPAGPLPPATPGEPPLPQARPMGTTRPPHPSTPSTPHPAQASAPVRTTTGPVTPAGQPGPRPTAPPGSPPPPSSSPAVTPRPPGVITPTDIDRGTHHATPKRPTGDHAGRIYRPTRPPKPPETPAPPPHQKPPRRPETE